MKRLLEVRGGLLLGATGLAVKPLCAGVNFIKSGKEVEGASGPSAERNE